MYLVFSTSGGMALECMKFHRGIAEKIVMKTKEEYAQVMNHLRTGLYCGSPFCVVGWIAVRGERGMSRKPQGTSYGDMVHHDVVVRGRYAILNELWDVLLEEIIVVWRVGFKSGDLNLMDIHLFWLVHVVNVKDVTSGDILYIKIKTFLVYIASFIYQFEFEYLLGIPTKIASL